MKTKAFLIVLNLSVPKSQDIYYIHQLMAISFYRQYLNFSESFFYFSQVFITILTYFLEGITGPGFRNNTIDSIFLEKVFLPVLEIV